MSTGGMEHTPKQASSDQVRTGDSLWTLQKNGRSIECAVRCSGTGRIEIQIRRNGELCAWTEFDEFEQAVAHGNALRWDLNATGWQAAG